MKRLSAIDGTYDHDGSYVRSGGRFTQAPASGLRLVISTTLTARPTTLVSAAFETALKEARFSCTSDPRAHQKCSKRKALPSGQPRGEAHLLKGLKLKRGEKTPIRELIAKFGNTCPTPCRAS